MKIEKYVLTLDTEKQVDFIDVTEQVQQCVSKLGIKKGLVTVFSPHTTASIALNHNEPMLIQDIIRTFYKLVPIDERYSHDMFELTNASKSDGRSNGHSHCKNIIMGVSSSIPVDGGKLALGDKQSIFFVEFDGGRNREFVVQIMGE